jgi:hypothetical protein
LPNKEHRLNGSYVARAVLKKQIMMLKSARQRFLHDLIVTMILALILKRSSPCAAVFELSKSEHFRHAMGK